MKREFAPSAGRVHYAWVIAAVTFLVLLGASGFRSTPGVLIVPLQEAFGWSRATIAFAVSINLLLFGFMGPFAAALMERFSLRAVIAAALLTIAAGAALTTRMTAPWQLYLSWGVLVGLGSGSIATVFAATVANRWFVQRRGLIVGVLTAASATGQLIFLPLLAWLVVHRGWRDVSWAVTIATLLVLPLVFIFIRNEPADLGLLAYGATGDEPARGAPGNPIANAFGALRDAAGNRDFWFLAGSFFVCGATTNGLIGTHLIPAGVDHGMTEVAAARLLMVIGIFDIVGTTLSGWLTDRYDARQLLFAYYALRGISLAILPFALNAKNFGLIAFIVFYGLDWVATVPPTISLTTTSFGIGNASLVFGWIFAAHQIGAAAAAYFAGLVRTEFGDYFLAFTSAAALCLAASMLVLQIGRAAPRDEAPPRRLAGPALSGASGSD